MRARRLARRSQLAVLALAAIAAALVFSSSAPALDLDTEVSLQDGEVGTPYEFQFEGEEGCLPYNYAFIAGTLPPGLTVQQNGLLTGIPTQAGTFDFWVELTDGIPGGACHSPTPSQGEYTVVIAPQVTIPATLAGAKLGTQVDTTVTATGGGSLVWTVTQGSLPPGFTLNRDTGRLTGVASAPGSYPFTIQVRDDKRRATKAFNFVIAPPLALSGATGRSEVGVALTVKPGSTGGIGPVGWAATDLPGGLSADVATGAISGTPTRAGSFTIPVTGTDVDGQTSQTTVNLTIAGRLAVTSSRLTARVGRRAGAHIARSGGVGPFVWRVATGKLPRGVTLNRSTGALAGTPRAAGTFRFTVGVTDALGVKTTRAITLRVRR